MNTMTTKTKTTTTTKKTINKTATYFDNSCNVFHFKVVLFNFLNYSHTVSIVNISYNLVGIGRGKEVGKKLLDCKM